MNITTILKISRPKFWGYLGGTFLVGYTLGIHSLNDFYTPTFFYLLVFFLIPANLYLYGINDLFDQDTDKHNPKKRTREHLLVKKETQSLVFLLVISFLIMLITLFILPTLSTKLFLLSFIFLATFYSAPPLRFKTKPILDSTSNILYTFPGLIGYLVLYPQSINWLIVLATFCWAGAMHLFSAIPDIDADTKANLNTTAIYLGLKYALIVCFLLWAAFAFIIIIQSNLNPVFKLATLIYPLIPLVLLFKPSLSISKIYWYFPWINNLLGFGLFILLISKK